MFTKDFEETLKKSQIGYTPKQFFLLDVFFSLIGSSAISVLFFFMFLKNKIPLYYSGIIFIVCLVFFYQMIRLIPVFALGSKKSMLESDLLYSARHLLLKLESGSSLLNSIESVSKLKTNSSLYFKTIVYDVSFGMSIEDAIGKASELSPSKAYTKVLNEIESSLRTGADIDKTLKATLDDISRTHLIQIQEYGRKLNPMSMFYMILGTILPSMGTAMLVVASSLMPGLLIIDFRILLSIAFLLLVVQVFFILAFKSLKPAVME